MLDTGAVVPVFLTKEFGRFARSQKIADGRLLRLSIAPNAALSMPILEAGSSNSGLLGRGKGAREAFAR